MKLEIEYIKNGDFIQKEASTFFVQVCCFALGE